MLSGAAEAVTLYYLYVAVSKEEVSRIFPLASAGPIFTLLLGWIFLSEALTRTELSAFGLFIVGGLFLGVKINRDSKTYELSRGLKPLLIGSLLSSSFTLFLKFVFTKTDFWTGFFYSRLGFFISGLLILLVWRKEIIAEWQKLRPTIRIAIIGNQTISFTGHLFYFLAISLASAALVQSTLSIQNAIIFLMASAVSLWRPHALQESTGRRDILQKIVGIAIIMGAAYMLVSP